MEEPLNQVNQSLQGGKFLTNQDFSIVDSDILHISGYRSFCTSFLHFDELEYESFLKTKLDHVESILKEFIYAPTGVSLCQNDFHVIASPLRNYRQRCKFQIIHNGDPSHHLTRSDEVLFESIYAATSTRQPLPVPQESYFQLKYALWEKGKPCVYLDDIFPVGSRLVCLIMEPLLFACERDPDLFHGLSGVSFLTTLYTSEVLIKLVYNQPLAKSWKNSAHILARYLWEMLKQHPIIKDTLLQPTCPGIKIIGRSKGVKESVFFNNTTENAQEDNRDTNICYDFVHESLTLSDGRILSYKQVEDGFSNPNAHVNRLALDWICDSARQSCELWRNRNANGDASQTTAATAINLLEMFCGNGNHTVALSSIFDSVIAVELNKSLCQAAKENLDMNCISNVEIIACDSAKFAFKLLRNKQYIKTDGRQIEFQVVLVDPPRCGLDEKSCSLAKHYDFIIYISCNPEALQRDLRKICTTHVIQRFAIFDQFAYTPHIECGVMLQKIGL